ncbi:MAG: hypothetical protein ACR2JU_12580 [Nocardioidaceae bacterium]
MRALVRDHLQVATCVGFGPLSALDRAGLQRRAQLRGVPADHLQRQRRASSWRFPATPTRSEVVKEAQARGDLDGLAQRGRRALRVDIGADPTAGLTALKDAIEQVLHYTTGYRAATWR